MRKSKRAFWLTKLDLKASTAFSPGENWCERSRTMYWEGKVKKRYAAREFEGQSVGDLDEPKRECLSKRSYKLRKSNFEQSPN